MDTFGTHWPHPDDTICSRKQMAKAGFYYTGIKDCVRCFVCQLKLEGWDPSKDDPWHKHAEVAPHCLFAQLSKEENHLTVEQWLDVFRDQAINKLDMKLNLLKQNVAPRL